MTAWLVRRVAAAIAIVWAVVTVTFVLVHVAPGTPFLPPAETPVDPAVLERLRSQFGLDRPLSEQYVRYLREIARGNLGESFALHRPVADALAEALPNTLTLAGAALCIEFVLGLALGVYQAARARRFGDVALGNATLFLYSVPTFWLGLLLLVVFGQWLRWFPVTARFERAPMLEVLGQDYVRTARAKGLPERRVVLGHALRNALLPFVTLFGLAFPFLLTGAVLVETVFAWPGMGRLAAEAIFRRDYPVVTAAAMLASGMVVLGSLLADLLYAAADPRIRTSAA